MSVFEVLLVFSTLLCSLVAGFLFSYAIVIMPGLKSLNDRQFILMFKATDRIIQNNHPLFMLVWIGSAVALVLSTIIGISKLHGLDLYMLIAATLGYILGVQVSTVVIHLPLNNKLQTLNVDSMKETDLKKERAMFESRWNRSNEIRTVVACIVSLLLIILNLRI